LRCEPLEHIPPSKQKIIDQLLDNQIVKVNDYVNEHRNIAINLKRLNDGRQSNRKEQQKTVFWKRFNWNLNRLDNQGFNGIDYASKRNENVRQRENSLSLTQKRKSTTCLFSNWDQGDEFNHLAIIETNVNVIQLYRYSIYQKS
jgi:hypothetical protein